MIKTNYGKKKTRLGRFVIIAPHGAGDDLKSGVVAVRLAKVLNSSYVINNKYQKPENKTNKNSDLIEDFNRLKWSAVKKKFLWMKKKPAMKEFYLDIANTCDKIKNSRGVKAVVIYVHGMQHKKIGVDIGVGLRPQGSRLFGSGYHEETGCNTGNVTIKISQAKKIFKIVRESLQKDFNLEVSTGATFSGWSKWSGIQFHKHGDRNDYAIQVEINKFLRSDDEKINYVVDLFSRALKDVF